MQKIRKISMVGSMLLSFSQTTKARKLTVKQSIGSAPQNCISLQKTHLQRLNSDEDKKQTEAELMSSLSFNISQDFIYNLSPKRGRTVVFYDKVLSTHR